MTGKQNQIRTVKDAGFSDVPDSCSLHYVPDHKLLDGLILRDAAGTVGAADGLHMPTALLGATVVPPFLGLLKQKVKTKERKINCKHYFLVTNLCTTSSS